LNRLGGGPARAVVALLAVLFVAVSANATVDVGAAVHDAICRH
jgi:hypothetical protein